MDSLTELFCLMDDSCQEFEPALAKRLLEQGQRKRHRPAGLCLSERLTLVVLFHQLRYRQFKAFYLHHARTHLRQEFPRLPPCFKLPGVINHVGELLAIKLTLGNAMTTSRCASCATACLAPSMPTNGSPNDCRSAAFVW